MKPQVSRRWVDPTNPLLNGSILVLAPHMDDETLACGGTMALHRKKSAIHCAFAADGARSPAPLLPWLGRLDPELPKVRRQEAIAAAARLGIPSSNLHFMDLPDGALRRHQRDLEAAIDRLVASIRPEVVFAPFRFDVHPDHVAVHRAVRCVLTRLARAPALFEYFVYHRLRLVPGGDVRRIVRQRDLLAVDITQVRETKRAALDCYASQTTLRYPWQDRPILTAESLAARCREPEFFLASDAAAPIGDGIERGGWRVRIATTAMARGKRRKDQALALLRWALRS